MIKHIWLQNNVLSKLKKQENHHSLIHIVLDMLLIEQVKEKKPNIIFNSKSDMEKTAI
jgi:hypothetical protein